MTKESDDFVRAIARGFAVVEALGHPPGRHRLTEVAQAASLNRATARRVLATLVALKYCEADGRYFRLRPRALGLGLSYLRALPFWDVAHGVLEDLRNEVGESCALAVLDEAEIVYVIRQPARRILASQLGVGSRLPAHLVSLGRVLLAALPLAERADLIARLDLRPRTPRSISSPEALARELARVDKQGYAWVDGELDPAICGLAVPARDAAGGTVIAALSFNAISGSIDEAKAKRRFLVPLRRAAQDIRAHMPAARSGASSL